MNESILDRLDRDPGGARDYVAQLHVFGANRKAICAKLATRFDIAEPTPRSLTNWLNGDEALLEKIAEEIIVKIREQYPFIREAVLSIYKLQAPIGNFQGKAGMTLHKKFDD